LVYSLADLVGEDIPKWTVHKEADVAVIPLNPPADFKVSIKYISINQIVDELNAPNLDLVLTTIGFPLNLGIGQKFSPIVKTSRAASGLFRTERGDTKQEANFFILEDPSVAGFSGAPVLKLSKVTIGVMSSGQGAFECVGLVHGTISDDTGGKFAAIVPGKYIRETIELAVKR